MRVVLYYFSLFFCCSILLSCGSSENENIIPDKAATDPFLVTETPRQQLSSYNFKTPSATFIMDEKLGEISSLAYDKNNHSFLTNNDEDGYFFSLDSLNLEIQSKEKFAKKGDYEAIEKIENQIIICKNNGTLYFYNQNDSETISYKTELSSENDVEGLCYDKKTNSLLLACKGQPLDSKNKKKKQKSIYQFDLETKKLNTKPFITITDSMLESYVDSIYKHESKSKLKALKNKAEDFAPSGIAIHPETKDYFIISAKASILVIMDQNTQLKTVIFLNEKTNPQPEGICFDKDNNLYISTEGQGFEGKIFKYHYEVN